jgi:hypothetical protein
LKITATTKILLIILFPLALILGIWVGTYFQTIGILVLVGVIAYVAWILMSNKQGARIDGAALADALAISPSAGKARIYAIRLGYYGRAQGMNVALSSGHQGQIRGKYFMMAELDPGPYVLSAQLAKQGGKTRSEHPINLAAGQSLLVEINLEMSMMAVTPLFTDHHNVAIFPNILRQAKMVDWLVKP